MIQLVDHEDVLALFVEGISGRYWHIKAPEEFASRKFELETDTVGQSPDSIFLPATLDAPDAGAYRLLALEQLGYRECGTYRFAMDVAIERVPELLEARNPQIDSRMGDFGQFYGCFDVPGLARDLFGLLELARVHGHLMRVYPGIVRHRQRYFEHQRSPQTDSVITPLEGARIHWMGGMRQLAIRTPRLNAELQMATDKTLDVYASAERTWQLYGELKAAYPSTEVDAFQINDDDLTDWLRKEERVAELDAQLDDVKGMLALATSGEGTVEADAQTLGEGVVREPDLDIVALNEQRDALARKAALERAAVNYGLGQQRPEARSFRYDEWNYLERRYLPRWCRVYEEPLVGEEAVEIGALHQAVAPWRAQVRRQLEHIRPLGMQRVYRVQDGDELDLNAIVAVRQDIRARRAPDERVYSRRTRIHRDVCAAFLVDLSASTGDPIEAPVAAAAPADSGESGSPTVWGDWDDDRYEEDMANQEPVRKVIDVQREAMLVMATALEELGDQYGIFGFSGYGRDCVELFVAKEINEPLTNAALRAIGAMSPKRSTRMGPAIRHATAKLMAGASALKILMVVSDGFPQDADYGPIRGDHEYGLQDTAKALQEAKEKGIETFCVTVDRSGHDYLKRMCPDARYLVIEEMDDLPGALSKVYSVLTAK
jgi:hypothetical protein